MSSKTPIISILTVSKRTGWEEIAERSIMNQALLGNTIREYEWVVVTENPLVFTEGMARVYQAPKKKQGRLSNLSASVNEGLRHCKGQYVVFYQDFIELDPGAIEALVMSCEETNGLVSSACIDHEGNFDSRYTGMDCLRIALPDEWETNFAVAPMSILRELGGSDEEYDYGFAWDNVNIAERASMLGATVWVNELVRPKLLYHAKERDIPPNGERHAKTMRAIREGRLPLKLNYL